MVPKTEKTPVEEDEKMETADEVGDENVDTTNEIKDEKEETPNGVEDEKVETKNEIKDEKVETTNEVEDEELETKTEVKVEKLETTDEEEDEKMETTNGVEDEKVETKNKIKDEKVETTNEVEDEEAETTNEVKVKKLKTAKGEEDEKMETTNEPEGNEIITKREDLTPFFKKRDHSVNQVHQSEVPQICKDEPCQLGVDEAGRGPVLGPMVYGISYAPLSQKKLLVDLGCADSKTLTEDKRDAIFDKICDNSDKMGWAIDSISPNYIANCMYRRCKTSLNEVSMDAAIGLIRKTIEAGVFVAEIYVDTVGKPEKYQAKLEGIFPGIKITVAKKADSTYPIVSAASICAKVSRDHALRAWQFREVENETEYGSGYPNDPLTKKWLADNVDPIFGFPQLVRFSWSTAEKILESKAISVEWEDPEEDSSPNEVKISKFFAPSPKATKQNEKTRHKFFTNRCLSSATTI